MDDNNNGAGKTNACEYPNDRAYNAIKDRNQREDDTVENMETESDDENARRNSISL